MTMEERQKVAKKERNKLTKILKPVMEPDAFKLAEDLIDNLAFMRASLMELRDDIREHGMVEEYQNGENQHGLKDSSYLKAYNNVLKSYNSTWRQLLALIPKKDRGDIDDDGFDSF